MPTERELEIADTATEVLKTWTQGCTEFSCIYHGAINAELRRRAGE